ncbi:hypothetical protein IAF17_18700, partial [Acinetobacter baumannii]|nr:hypothetical protein [Acinetobacter baumannii]
LSSGAVILAYHHEQNIFKMGGLFYKNKFLFACFAIGGGALAAPTKVDNTAKIPNGAQ